MRLTQPER